MPRKPIPKTIHRVTAIELDEHVDAVTGQIRRQLEIHEPDIEEPGPYRGRPPRGGTRTRVNRGRKRRVSQAYVMLDTESVGMLDLSRQEQRVFAFLLSKMDPSGEIRVTTSYVAKSIGMTANNASKTMRSLRERQVILAESYGVWRLNANIGWMGEWKKWARAAADDPEPIWTLEERPVLTVVE